MKRKKGFTLVELLVVIAILAILSSVSVVGYLGFTKKAKESNAITEMKQMDTLLRGKYLSSKAPTSSETQERDVVYFDQELLVVDYKDKQSSTPDTENLLNILQDKTDEGSIDSDLSLWNKDNVLFSLDPLYQDDDNGIYYIRYVQYSPEQGISVVWDIKEDMIVVGTLNDFVSQENRVLKHCRLESEDGNPVLYVYGRYDFPNLHEGQEVSFYVKIGSGVTPDFIPSTSGNFDFKVDFSEINNLVDGSYSVVFYYDNDSDNNFTQDGSQWIIEGETKLQINNKNYSISQGTSGCLKLEIQSL